MGTRTLENMSRWPGMLTDGGLGGYYQLTEREKTGLDSGLDSKHLRNPWHKLFVLEKSCHGPAYDLEQ